MYFATPSANPNVGFDYDCSGTPDPEFPDPVDCGLVSGSCDAGVGFLKMVPPCGAAGPWGSCHAGEPAADVHAARDRLEPRVPLQVAPGWRREF